MKIVYKPGAKYVIHAPNENYTGVTAGLEFSKGRGVIDPDTYRNLADNQRSPADTLTMIQQDSPEYRVEEVPQRVYTVPDTDHLRDEDGRLRTAETADKPARRRTKKE